MLKFNKVKVSFILTLFVVLSGLTMSAQHQRPNILWITSEDNSPFLGCYGDAFATTPTLDKLASEGFRYTNAYANCPVCAPARNTIITGVYAASNGNEQMRSTYPKSKLVIPYSELLRKAGYYCTNNVKTDYNFAGDYKAMWDECSPTAHWKNSPEGKPFFAIFNLLTTHESQIFPYISDAELRHKPEDVVLPPYHPDTKEMRHDWAQYYDKIEDMDAQVGSLLKELEESGLAENTIVFYYADHGGVLARSKRYLFETGTWVPFIVRIPEQYKKYFPAEKPGDTVDRNVSFVDLAPTLLSLIGEEKPDYMQGNAFLGNAVEPEPRYVHLTRGRMDERIDMSRAVLDKKYRYIRNYMPFRIYMQHLAYLFNARSAQSWENYYQAGRCNELQSIAFQPKPVEELYDTENDPNELYNLADDPEYKDVLERMRKENIRWMKHIRDVALIPETEYAKRAGDGSMYDYMRSEACPFDDLLAAAELATEPGKGAIYDYIELLKNKDSAIRFWGVTGLLIHIDNAEQALPALKAAADEDATATAVLIGEALCRLGEKELAETIFLRILKDEHRTMMERTWVLNSVDAIDFRTLELEKWINDFYNGKKSELKGFDVYSNYDFSMCKTILEKWDVI
ncbi:Arylsulfatase A [Draconibacterium orientale]|uniref:Arylsulfatase A n=2 Tax=Draconibacterium orientale TaxID=1168034 RepID=A0A1H9Y5R5_9BACT|nr:sulfatase [Draconibacterium orientale]SES64211.1 Arylsulfatase A [Draconibacterium orientale]